MLAAIWKYVSRSLRWEANVGHDRDAQFSLILTSTEHHCWASLLPTLINQFFINTCHCPLPTNHITFFNFHSGTLMAIIKLEISIFFCWQFVKFQHGHDKRFSIYDFDSRSNKSFPICGFFTLMEMKKMFEICLVMLICIYFCFFSFTTLFYNFGLWFPQLNEINLNSGNEFN